MGRLDDQDMLMLMPIGRFARASRLSIKSLRNYDESGLLPAAFVDSQSGYRYYRIEQLARADAIRSLRMVGMPLPAIAEALDGDEPESLLMSHLAALEEERDEIRRKAQELKRRIQTKEYVMSTEVTLKINDTISALAYRTETTFSGIFNDIPAGFGQVMGTIAEENIDPVGAPFTLYYQAPDGDTVGEIAMCVPIAEGSAEGVVGGEGSAGGLQAVTVPAGGAASIIHRGSYDNMGESYATVAAWAQQRGHEITGPTREIYLNSPVDTAEADLLTELLFPIGGDASSHTSDDTPNDTPNDNDEGSN